VYECWKLQPLVYLQSDWSGETVIRKLGDLFRTLVTAHALTHAA